MNADLVKKIYMPFYLVIVLIIFAINSLSQELSIVGIRNQQITFENLHDKNQFSLEYAYSPSGPWTNWGFLTDSMITGTVMSADLPMYFRIRAHDTSSRPLIATGTPLYVESDPGFISSPAAMLSSQDVSILRSATGNTYTAGGTVYPIINTPDNSPSVLITDGIHTQASWQAVDQLQTIPPPVQGVLLCNTNEIKWMGNDGQSLRTAMTQLKENGRIYLGPGTYVVNSILTFTVPRSKIIGSGNPVYCENTKTLTGGTLLKGVQIREGPDACDFGLENLGIETTNTTQDVIVTDRSDTSTYLGLTLKNISVLGRTNTAHIIGASGRNIRLENVRSYFGVWGVALKTYDLQWHGGTVCNASLGVYIGANDRIGQPTASKNNTISNVEFVRTHDYIAQGFQIGAVSGATTDGLFIHNCRALSGVKSLIRVQSPGIDFGDANSGIQGAVIDTCYAETPSSHAFSFVEGAQHVIVNNCTVYNSPHIPIYVRYSTNITVRNANMIQCAGTYAIGDGGHLRECSINGIQYLP